MKRVYNNAVRNALQKQVEAFNSVQKVSQFITDVLDGKVQDGKILIELPVQINKLAEKAVNYDFL
ncbi:MAG: hypothetical protein LBR17_03065 [Bacteroidales bacterium]|nr:hypothetical protein [Bacteroidales bacterium]